MGSNKPPGYAGDSVLAGDRIQGYPLPDRDPRTNLPLVGRGHWSRPRSIEVGQIPTRILAANPNRLRAWLFNNGGLQETPITLPTSGGALAAAAFLDSAGIPMPLPATSTYKSVFLQVDTALTWASSGIPTIQQIVGRGPWGPGSGASSQVAAISGGRVKGPAATIPVAVPTQVEVSNGNQNAALQILATLPGVVGSTTWITGFEVTGTGATAGAAISVTVTGILGGLLPYTFDVPVGALAPANPLIVTFPRPIPASGQNIPIVVTVPSFGAGNTQQSVTAHGFQQAGTTPGTTLAAGLYGFSPADLTDLQWHWPFVGFELAFPSALTAGAARLFCEVPGGPALLIGEDQAIVAAPTAISNAWSLGAQAPSWPYDGDGELWAVAGASAGTIDVRVWELLRTPPSPGY